jgi:uncharacterized protein (TIGR02246 family)
MKKILWSITFGALMMCQIAAAELPLEKREKDEKAIKQIVWNWIAGWERCDSQLAIEGFAEDADWMNAFGIKKNGRKELKEFLDWVFSLPNAKERKNTETITSIRFIRPDVALVYADFLVEKQRYLNGEEMADRVGHDIRVMLKENDKWEIVSMLIMDEKARSHTTSDKKSQSKLQELVHEKR